MKKSLFPLAFTLYLLRSAHHHLPPTTSRVVVIWVAYPGLIFYQAVRLALKIASLSCCIGFYDDSHHVIIHVAFHNCAVAFNWSTPWLLSGGKFSMFPILKTHMERERGTDMEGEERGIWLEKQEECSRHSDTLCYHPGELTQPSLSCTGGEHTHEHANAHSCSSCHISLHPLLLSAFLPFFCSPSISLSPSPSPATSLSSAQADT